MANPNFKLTNSPPSGPRKTPGSDAVTADENRLKKFANESRERRLNKRIVGREMSSKDR